MEKKRDIIWIGTTGVGKTGLATSFLIQAINRGYNGRFITFPELVELLVDIREVYHVFNVKIGVAD